MKKYVMDFIRRGLIASGFGPIALAIFYLIMHRQGQVQTLEVDQVCLGILSLAALAFVAGGMNAIYQIERLPLPVAILIHGSVLYVCYLLTYLVNSWLKWSLQALFVFTAIFVVGYLAIWAIIYTFMRRNTARINESLKKKQQASQN